jgi:hypothetical protein
MLSLFPEGVLPGAAAEPERPSCGLRRGDCDGRGNDTERVRPIAGSHSGAGVSIEPGLSMSSPSDECYWLETSVEQTVPCAGRIASESRVSGRAKYGVSARPSGE